MPPTRLLRLVVSLALGIQGAAAAEQGQPFKGKDLRAACENLVLASRGIQEISQQDPGAMLCLGYIAGWTQGMEFSSPHLRGGQPAEPVCWPESVSTAATDVAALLVDYVDAESSRAALSAHEVLLGTLQEAFPCPEAPIEED